MKYLFLILSMFFFFSCNQVVDCFLTEHAKDHNLYYMEEWEELESFYDIGDWVNKNVPYRSDVFYEWSDPKVSIDRGYGDCNDRALVFANIAYRVKGIKMDLVAVNQSQMEFEPQYSIESGGFVDHIMLRYQGQVYSTTGGTFSGSVGFYYSFNNCFK